MKKQQPNKINEHELEELEKELQNDKIIGYCLYCKGPIYQHEKYRGKNFYLKHKQCRNEELGIIEELIF